MKICSTCFLVRPLIGLLAVHDDGDAIVGDDSWLHVHAFSGSGADFGWLRAPAGHADLGGSVDDSGDAGGRTFGSDVEGRAGMLRFELLGQLRNQFRAESIGAFDNQPVGAGCGSYASAKRELKNERCFIF